MTKPDKSLTIVVLALALAAASPLSASRGEELLTVAESSGFTDTSRYEDVIAFIRALQGVSRNIRVETMCLSTEGREVPLLVLGDPLPSSPADLRFDRRPVIYIQANIHAGEVEGKEASLMLARDILRGEAPPLLEDLVILIAPIFNADGNEKVDPGNRTNQVGPGAGVGVRHNGQMLDLNRDCVKLESPEITGMVRNVLNAWDPVLMVDCHTTNGSYHEEPVTYSWPLNPNGDLSIIGYMRDKMMPSISATLEEDYGFLSIPYGRWVDPEDPEKGWRTFNTDIRFVTNYVGARNRFAILDENYAYADYETRVKGCYSFLLSIARFCSDHGEEMLRLAAEADERTAARWMNRSPADSFAVASKARALEKPVTIRGWEMKVARVEGSWPRVEKTDRKRTFKAPYLADFVPTVRRAFPYAYLIPNPDREIEGVLLRHGIVMEKLIEPVVLEVEKFITTELKSAEELYQGHCLTSLEGRYETAEMKVPAGTLFIGTSQRLGGLAACLLEPDSGDGLLTWNFFDRYLLTQWRRTLLPYPVYRLMEPAAAAKVTFRP